MAGIDSWCKLGLKFVRILYSSTTKLLVEYFVMGIFDITLISKIVIRCENFDQKYKINYWPKLTQLIWTIIGPTNIQQIIYS
jgi:hypothetical protein